MDKRFRIMILSAGSLLGQNILDQLEGRRERVHITGMDCSSNNPRIFRCDKAIKSPQIDEVEFEKFLIDNIETEKPELILPGRDHDACFLAEFSEKHPKYKLLVACGKSEAIHIMNDKAKSFEFAQKHSLPFMETFIFSETNFEEALAWANSKEYPLLLKPREGYGSLGMRIICNEEHLKACAKLECNEFVLQEMADISEQWRSLIGEYQQNIEAGIPFFFHMPDENQYAGQAIISPDGSVGETFASRSLMVLGRCERTERIYDQEFDSVIRAFAEAISQEGWRGMFNLQCRKTESGYCGIEMNGRMSGSTSARLWLGYDETRELIRSFKNVDIGQDQRIPSDNKGIVYRSLTDYYVSKKDQEKFKKDGFWKK